MRWNELPPAVDADYSFASYHSKTEAKGNVLTYTRTMEIEELRVPVDKLDQLQGFYRAIAGDERNTAVLKPVANSQASRQPTFLTRLQLWSCACCIG